MTETNAYFGLPVASLSGVIGRTFGSSSLIVPNFCCKVFDVSLNENVFFRFLFNVEFYHQVLINLFEVCSLNIFAVECTLPE